MLPIAFENRMREMLGSEFEAFLKGYEECNYQSFRLNPLKKAEGKESFDVCAAKFGLEPVAWEPAGFYYGEEDRPGRHAYHDAGVYYIQEASAMLPVRLLDVKPGEYCLDLCAAPGGKSTQIAGYLQGKGLLVCNEIFPARAKILSENIERMGVPNALVTNESPDRLMPHFIGFFDKILVDAPCSGEGMFRKNEEAIGEWSEENVALCAERQREILNCAAAMLRPGGRLVYSTCTFAPAENEENMRWFTENHPEFQLIDIPEEYKEKVNYREGEKGMLRIYPHRTKGEGHFAAILEKTGDLLPRVDTGFAGSKKSGKKDDGFKDYELFVQETLAAKPEDLFGGSGYLTFGEQLYLKPAGIMDITGLKVLRPGLHLGTMRKNRFEPSHALALALNTTQVKHVYDMDSEDKQVLDYRNGQTFAAEGEKGWYLICADGYSIGWGKLAGGVMKNHYPKGLRVNF